MLSGNLVRLRTLDMSDLDRYLAWMNDEEVTRFLDAGYGLCARGAETEWLERQTKRGIDYGDLTLAIETLEGRHIGSIALHNGSRAPQKRKATLGIMIGDKACWSRGYGTDAILTLLRFGFEEMNLNRIDLTVDADNPRAIACYGKCGFVEEGRMRQDRYRGGVYIDTLVMSVLAEEFRTRGAS